MLHPLISWIKLSMLTGVGRYGMAPWSHKDEVVKETSSTYTNDSIGKCDPVILVLQKTLVGHDIRV